MKKWIVYKDLYGSVRFIEAMEVDPVALVRNQKSINSMLVEAEAPIPMSPVLCLIQCK